MGEASERVLARLLKQHTGQTLPASRLWRIETTLAGMLRERGIDSIDRLVTMILAARDPSLGEAVAEALLNNETSFYRDLATFRTLVEEALPALAARRQHCRRLRIWSAGCSTGQELWSVAMHFAEHRERWPGWTIELLGSDISRTAISRAIDGRYTQFEIQRGLPVKLMMKWFAQVGDQWAISPALREGVSFVRHNVLDPAPRVGRYDIILCRNVLLYFDAAERRRVFSRMADAIAPDGMLMLGAGETVIGQTDSFAADPDRRGLYRRNPTATGFAAHAA